MPMHKHLFVESNPIPLKWAMQRMGLCGGTMRLPMTPLSKGNEAIVESAIIRFRPIMLTAAAAILAMIPLIGSTFWGPMAVAIMGGLLVATVLTLIYLPAAYAAWFKVGRAE